MTESPVSLPADATQRGRDRVWHVSFGGLLAVAFVTFVLWSHDYVGNGASFAILITTIVFAMFMAFNIGGNDVANSFGTSVGAGTLTMKQALLVAAVFEVSGAVLAGGEVTDTVRSGIVDLNAIDVAPMGFAFIMMSSLLGAALWLLIATRQGWPVSTTHSIIGGIVGAALTVGFMDGTGGWNMVQWDEIGQIALSWVLSPVLGAVLAYMFFGLVKKYVLRYNERAERELRDLTQRRSDAHRKHTVSYEKLTDLQRVSYSQALERDSLTVLRKNHAREDLESEYYQDLFDINAEMQKVNANRALETWVPVLAAFGAMVIGAMLLFKGLKNLDLSLSTLSNISILALVGIIVWLVVFAAAKALRHRALSHSTFVLFSWMQVCTASAFAFSHGSNDIANAIGPFAAILDVLKTGEIGDEAVVPPAAMLAMGVALVCGLWFIGRFVIKTVGSGLTAMHPASGFSAELAAAGVVMAASLLGLPVSSTHILIGAVLGVGIVNRAANWKLMKPIGMAWVITLPAAALIASVGVIGLRLVFG